MFKRLLYSIVVISSISYGSSIAIIADLGNKDNLYSANNKCKIFTKDNGAPNPVDVNFKSTKDSVLKGINVSSDRCVNVLKPYHPSLIIYSDNNIKMDRGWYYSSEFANMFNVSILLNSDKFNGDSKTKYAFLIDLLNKYSDRSFLLPWSYESHKKRSRYENNIKSLKTYINENIKNKKVKIVLLNKISEIKSYIDFADTVYVKLNKTTYGSYKGPLYKVYNPEFLNNNSDYEIINGKLYKYDTSNIKSWWAKALCDYYTGRGESKDIKFYIDFFDLSIRQLGGSIQDVCFAPVSIDDFKSKTSTDFQNLSNDFNKAMEQIFNKNILDILYDKNTNLEKISIVSTMTFASPNIVALYYTDVNNQIKYDKFINLSEAVTLFSNIKYMPKFNTLRIYKSQPIIEGFYRNQQQITLDEQKKVSQETEEVINNNENDNNIDYYETINVENMNHIGITPINNIKKPIKNALFIVINHKNIFEKPIKDIWKYIVGLEPLKQYYKWDGFNTSNDLYLFETDEDGKITKFIDSFPLSYVDQDTFMKIVDPRILNIDPNLMGNTNEKINYLYKRVMEISQKYRNDISFDNNNAKKYLIIIDHIYSNYDKLPIDKNQLEDIFNNDNNNMYISGDTLMPFNIDLEMYQHKYKIIEKESHLEPIMETIIEDVEVCENNDMQDKKQCHIETQTREVQKTDKNGNLMYKRVWEDIGSSDPSPYKCTAKRKFDNDIGEMFIEHKYYPYVNNNVVSADNETKVIFYDKVWDKKDILDDSPFLMYTSEPYDPNIDSTNYKYYEPLYENWFTCHTIDEKIPDLEKTSYQTTYNFNLQSLLSGNINYRNINNLDTFLSSCNINLSGDEMIYQCHNKNPLNYLIDIAYDGELVNKISRWWYVANDNIIDLGITKIYYICDGQKYLDKCEGLYDEE